MAEEYIVPLGIDADSILQGFREVEQGIDRLETKANESGKAMTTAFSKGAKSANEMDDAVEKIAPSIERVNSVTKDVRQSMNTVANATENAVDDKKVNRFRSAWERLKTIITGNTTETKRMNNESEKMNKTLGSVNDRIKQIKQILPTLKFGNKEDLEHYKKLNKELEELEREQKKINFLGRDNNKNIDGASKGVGGLGAIAKNVVPIIAAVFTVDKIVQFGKAVIETTAKFQKLEAMLKVALGSESSAKKAIIEIQEFASNTPFQVDEVTESYVKLANRGLTPTIEELTKMGDLASSQGKSLDQLTEAILDAVTGEYERMKEFGIRASKDGDKVTLAFKGITKEVENSQDAIKNAILEFGAMKGVAGGMEEQSKTIGGAISNMQDAWDSFLNAVGGGIAPMVTTFLKGITKMIEGLQDLIGKKEDAVDISVETVKKARDEASSGQALLDRYIALKNKGVKATSDEKQEMASITYQLIDMYGMEIVKINEVTGAYEIQIEVLKEAIKQKMLLANQEVSTMLLKKAKIQDDLEAKEREQQARDWTYKNMIQDDELVKMADNAYKPVSSRSDKLNYDYLSKSDKKRVDELVKARQLSTQADNEVKELKNDLSKVNKGLEEVGAENIDLRKVQADEAKRLKELNEKKNKPTGSGSPRRSSGSGRSLEDIKKEQEEQLRKYQRALEDAVIEAMEDGYEKEKKLIETQFIREKEDLEKEKSLSKENAEEKIKLIEQLEKNKNAKIAELQKKENEERLALIIEGQKQMNSLRKEGIEKTLGAIDIEFKEQEKAIKEKYKDMFFLQTYLLGMLQKQRDEKIKNAKYDNEVKKLEDNARLQTALAQAYGDKLIDIWTSLNLGEEKLANGNKMKLEQIHKSKALTIIAIDIKLAQELAELAEKQYGADSYEAKLAKARVAQLKIEFEEEIKRMAGTISLDGLFSAIKDIGNGDLAGSLGKAFTFKLSPDDKSIAESLGLDEEQQQAIIGSFTAVYDAIKDAYMQFIEEQIQAKDEQISILDDQISKAEEAYNHELELQKQGFHNNVDAKRKELEDLKKMREQEQKEKEALQEKQKRMAQVEIALQTVIATAQLIAAAAKAFSAHSGIPFVGVALGAAAAASLISGFVAMKALASGATKFEKGGKIGGESHSRGGTKYYSDNPNAGVLELEKDEYVTNKKSTAKHFGLLEAINNDKLENFVINDAEFKKMLNGLGVTLMDDKEEAIQQNYELGTKVVQVIYGNSNGLTNQVLNNIERNTKVLADAEENKEITTFENGYKIVKKGNTTRKIKLKP